jgi:hypothetical protein
MSKLNINEVTYSVSNWLRKHDVMNNGACSITIELANERDALKLERAIIGELRDLGFEITFGAIDSVPKFMNGLGLRLTYRR